MQIGLGPIFQPASSLPGAITELFVIVLVICGVILAVVTVWVCYCILYCRAEPGAPEPKQVHGNLKMEITWTAIPLVIVIFIFFITLRVMGKSDPAPHREPDLIVTGHQWWWEALYPANGVHVADEIHIATGKPYLLRIRSADVLHDFWTPQLGRKIHGVPGHPNDIWVEADQAGSYWGECAEYCGGQHAWMRFVIIAEPESDFEAWTKQQLQPMPGLQIGKAGRGRKIFQQEMCVNCHAIAGVSTNGTAGPDLTHLSTRQIIGGGVLTNTPENLASWLKDPQKAKPSSLMPNFNLSDEQVQELTAFLESTK